MPKNNSKIILNIFICRILLIARLSVNMTHLVQNISSIGRQLFIEILIFSSGILTLEQYIQSASVLNNALWMMKSMVSMSLGSLVGKGIKRKARHLSSDKIIL